MIATRRVSGWARIRDRLREFPAFEHFVRAVSGCDYSATRQVKSWSREKYQRLWQKTKSTIRHEGVPLRHVRDWVDGKNNLKVLANLTSRSGQTLIYLDIDCHGRGDPKDAERLCRLLLDRLPHGQPLVTERGASAWVMVDLAGADPKSNEYNALIDRIETYIRGEAAEKRLNLSGVEVKGRVAVWDGRNVVRCADMMKCPRGWEHVGPAVAYHTLAEADWTPPAASPATKAKLRSGSSQFLPPPAVGKNGLDHLVGLVSDWFPDRPTRTRNDRLITDERFAEVMLVMAHLRQNKDGTLPHQFAKAVWQQWHADGVLVYGWVSEVWQTVRDYLSAGGFLFAEDGGEYVPPVRDHAGRIETRGRAAKWCLLDWMQAVVRATAESGAVFGDEAVKASSAVVESAVLLVLGSGNKAGGELVHTSLSSPPKPRFKPWRVHPARGVRPLWQIPRDDWERLDNLLAA